MATFLAASALYSQYACSVLPPFLKSFCCWRRRTYRLSEGGQVFLSHPELSFCTNLVGNCGAIAPCSLDFLTEVGWRSSAATRRYTRDGILVSAHLCRTSTVQCGTHTRVFCRTRRRAGPLAIPTCVLASGQVIGFNVA